MHSVMMEAERGRKWEVMWQHTGGQGWFPRGRESNLTTEAKGRMSQAKLWWGVRWEVCVSEGSETVSNSELRWSNQCRFSKLKCVLNGLSMKFEGKNWNLEGK